MITDVTIILPCLNESRNLDILLPQLAQYRTLVVDDSSGTEKYKITRICKDNEVVYLEGYRDGLTAAIFQGIGFCRTKYVVVMDSDGQHSPKDIPKLLGALEGHSLVAGVRTLSLLNPPGLPLHRRIFSLTINTALKPVSKGISDPLTGMFAVDKTILNSIHLNREATKAFLEILTKTTCKVEAVAIEFKRRPNGSPTFGNPGNGVRLLLQATKAYLTLLPHWR